MRLIITSPDQLKSERAKLLQEAIDLLNSQQRSSLRYATKIKCIRNKIENVDKQLGG